jgi:AcrR family transcriptional regulator
VARTVNVTAHALRRDEFLDAAQRLLERKGYEQMSVHDVLSELGASKGSFYHYFGSKQALLEAVVARMADAVAAALSPVAGDSTTDAVAKLDLFFTTLAHWKAQRRELLVAVLRVWYSDGNALVRQKLRGGIADRIAPLLADILRQGVAEGAVNAAHPDQFGRVVVSLIQDLNDRLADLFFAAESGHLDPDAAERTVAAYTAALERILGIPAGRVVLVDPSLLRQWFTPNDQQIGAR